MSKSIRAFWPNCMLTFFKTLPLSLSIIWISKVYSVVARTTCLWISMDLLAWSYCMPRESLRFLFWSLVLLHRMTVALMMMSLYYSLKTKPAQSSFKSISWGNLFCNCFNSDYSFNTALGSAYALYDSSNCFTLQVSIDS